jgi:hypothetical protein
MLAEKCMQTPQTASSSIMCDSWPLTLSLPSYLCVEIQNMHELKILGYTLYMATKEDYQLTLY